MSGGADAARDGAGVARDGDADASRAFGAALGAGRLRTLPEDFVVSERLSFSAKGSGPHWLLHVRKRGANTPWVARRLAAFAGARLSDVGYAGLKDRHAVTEQWFSVPVARDGGPDWTRFQDPECSVLSAERHDRKLRHGAARANAFDIRVRDCQVDAAALAARVAAVRCLGVPNAFGVQRFGRDGDNAARGLALLEGRLTVRDRTERGLLISAVRSELFNSVLAARVADGTWGTARAGECLMLDGTHSTFVADPTDPDLARRLAELDVHPTGPLPGAGEPRCRDEALAYETAVLASRTAVLAALQGAGVAADRRALRVAVRGLEVDVEPDALRFRFVLGGGAYATAVLDQFIISRDAP